MRTVLTGAIFGALVACGSSEAPVDGNPPQGSGVDSALSTNDPLAAQMAGTYEVTAEDGTVVRQTINADGSYIETFDGTETERGTWQQKGGQMCYDPESDMIEQCYTGGPPGGDGSYEVEMAGGTAFVRRVDDSEAREPATVGADKQ